MAIGLFEIRSKDAFSHVVHHRSPDGQPRIGFFTAVLWQGEPANLEPNKCAGLHWANPARPPANTVRYTAAAVAAITGGASSPSTAGDTGRTHPIPGPRMRIRRDAKIWQNGLP